MSNASRRTRGAWLLGIALVLGTGHALVVGEKVRRAHAPRVLPVPAHPGALLFSPRGDTLAVANGESEIEIFSCASGERLRVLHGAARITHLAFSPDGSRLAADGQTRLHVWSLATGQLEHTINPVAPADEILGAVAFVDSGDALVAAAPTGLHVWTIADERFARVLTSSPLTRPCDFALSRRGDLVATIMADGLRVFATANGSPRTEREESSARALVATEDDAFLVAELGDLRKLRVVRTPGEQVLGSFALGCHGVTELSPAVAISPDGELVAVSLAASESPDPGWDATPSRAEVEVWSVHDGALVTTFTGPREELCKHLAFSPTGESLAGSWRTQVYVWPLRR